MSNIEWDDSLSVGVNLIDEQHKQLIRKIKDIDDALRQGKGAAMILKTLDFMYDYTEFHFKTEEKNMITQEYPGLDYHKAAHEEFKGMVKQMIDDFHDEGSTVPLANSINTYLMNWLVKHIKGTDVEFGAYLKEKGIYPEE